MHDRSKKERKHIKTTNNEHKSIITKKKKKKLQKLSTIFSPCIHPLTSFH